MGAIYGAILIFGHSTLGGRGHISLSLIPDYSLLFDHCTQAVSPKHLESSWYDISPSFILVGSLWTPPHDAVATLSNPTLPPTLRIDALGSSGDTPAGAHNGTRLWRGVYTRNGVQVTLDGRWLLYSRHL